MKTLMRVNDAPRILQEQLIIENNQGDCCDGGITAIVRNIFCLPCFLHQKISHKRDIKQVSAAINELMVSEDTLKEMSDEDKLKKIRSQNAAIIGLLETLPDQFKTTKDQNWAQTIKTTQKTALSQMELNDPRLALEAVRRELEEVKRIMEINISRMLSQSHHDLIDSIDRGESQKSYVLID